MLGALAIGATFATSGSGGLRADDGATMRVAYRGEIFDDQSRALSGIYPLTFAILGPTAQPVWSEQQFVAVYDGAYAVQLGRTGGVPRAYAGTRSRVRVSLGDLVLSEHVYQLDEYAAASVPAARVEPIEPVDLAGRAVRADRAYVARDCRTLQGRSAEQLDHSVDLRNRLDELRARINRPGGNRIGTPTVTLPRAGGEGGLTYERNCPAGFVATGARGGMGELVDSVRLICTQLE